MNLQNGRMCKKHECFSVKITAFCGVQALYGITANNNKSVDSWCTGLIIGIKGCQFWPYEVCTSETS